MNKKRNLIRNLIVCIPIGIIIAIIALSVYYIPKIILCDNHGFSIEPIENYKGWAIQAKQGEVLNACSITTVYSIHITYKQDIDEIWVSKFDYDRYGRGDIIR